MIKSKLPYKFSDQEWTKLVFDRLQSWTGDMLDMMVMNPFEVVQRELIEELSDIELPEFKPRVLFIDYKFAPSTKVSDTEAASIRDGSHSGMSPEVLAGIFKVSVEAIEDVLNGTVWPCSGGVLRPLNGLGLYIKPGTKLADKNETKVIAGILSRAINLLSAREFQLLAEQNGLTVSEAYRIIPGASPDHERYLFRREHSGLPKTKTGWNPTRQK